jgi:hypothetical protein
VQCGVGVFAGLPGEIERVGRAVAEERDQACDEDAYRFLNTPGQAVSGVDDQARWVLGRAG